MPDVFANGPACGLGVTVARMLLIERLSRGLSLVLTAGVVPS